MKAVLDLLRHYLIYYILFSLDAVGVHICEMLDIRMKNKSYSIVLKAGKKSSDVMLDPCFTRKGRS